LEAIVHFEADFATSSQGAAELSFALVRQLTSQQACIGPMVEFQHVLHDGAWPFAAKLAKT